jgi:hypothetical protein
MQRNDNVKLENNFINNEYLTQIFILQNSIGTKHRVTTLKLKV